MLKIFLSVLCGDLTPDQIQRILGMSCDSSWRSGDLFTYPSAARSRQRRQNCWRISCIADQDRDAAAGACDVSEYVARLLARVKGRESGFLKLVGLGCNVELSISLVSANIPALNFAPEVLAGLVAIGASLDIDIVLTEEISA